MSFRSYIELFLALRHVRRGLQNALTEALFFFFSSCLELSATISVLLSRPLYSVKAKKAPSRVKCGHVTTADPEFPAGYLFVVF